MPSSCAAAGCRGNYRGEPYSRVVRFPKDEEKRQAWIDAMPNDPETLKHRKEIWICAAHFDCEWVNIRGGKYPAKPPSIFPGAPKSCLKQTRSTPRQTQAATSEVRGKRQQSLQEARDRITNFDNFVNNIKHHIENYSFIHNDNDFTMFMTDTMGRKVIQFLHFRNVESNFGFLKLISAEKNGFEVPKSKFSIQKDCLIHKWSDLKSIINVINDHDTSYVDHLNRALQELDLCDELLDSPNFQFIQDQLQLLLKPPSRRRYSKHTVIFALELLGVSPAAYRLVRNSKSMILPGEKFIRSLLSNTFQDENLSNIFENLQPQQRIVNILFDEVKLKQVTRYCGGHIMGYAENNSSELATSALVIELVCHYGGPRYIMRIYPVNRLKADQLRGMVLEAANAVVQKGGHPLSFICDNCPLNQKTYKELGGPGKVDLQPIGISVFMLYDYVHIFKNIRNNWYTEPSKELTFLMDGKEYVASWQDIVTLYDADKAQPVRLTNLR